MNLNSFFATLTVFIFLNGCDLTTVTMTESSAPASGSSGVTTPGIPTSGGTTTGNATTGGTTTGGGGTIIGSPGGSTTGNAGTTTGTTTGGTTTGGVAGDPPNGTTLPAMSGVNVLPLTVNGSLCASNSYPNKPCVSVTICTPGFTDAAHCNTVTDILVDTGSYGLRVFGSKKSVLTNAVPTPITTTSGKTLAECSQFGDGSSLWGPVSMASVTLGSETPVQIPIQVIDSTFSGAAAKTNCTGAATDPGNGNDTSTVVYAGFNGILGVGLAAQDCGSDCVSNSKGIPELYYSCDGSSTCIATYVALANQVINPVAALSTDGNGVIMELPSLAQAVSSNGYLVLGIGTRSNNIPPTGVIKLSANSNAEFSTTFEGHSYTSFIDSGSNALYFPSTGTGLPDCGSTDSTYTGWYCPTAVATFGASNVSTNGSPSAPFQFQVSNFITFWNSVNYVDAQMAGNGGNDSISSDFDVGLPFFFGRNVYVGISLKVSPVGTGPFWAY